ncbi:uncharacterized protein LOC120293792 [Eucalyptus grandis]|uniref:uncharacterized protein LOC120293792 n=1 Tax=Eucalyptus grandis TaxID=71139 RepID=UPI00192EE4EA|nr:uncharacterized protein LOC120293792 [Eucalyptus grandis]
MRKEFREAIIEEVDDSRDLPEGSIDIRMEEEVGDVPHDRGDDDEDAILDDELLSGPDIDDFEETNSTIGQMVNRYDPMCDHNENMFSLGMRFESHEQFKNAVRKYAVINGFNIFWPRSQKKRMEAKCASGCGWRLYGSWVQAEKTFVIKRVGSLHSCNRSLTNRQATSTWLAREYMPKIRARLTYSATEMQTDARERFALILNKKKCYRAIWTALSHIRGPIGKQYDMLRSYLEELKRVSKNGTFMMEVNPATKVFERFYVGFDELKNGFLAGCRRVIGLDGCFLKTGLRGMLLCAIGRDGNNQMFPIAWAIVEVESEASWTWFLTRD